MDAPHIYALQHPLISPHMTLDEMAPYHRPGLYRGVMLSTLLTIEQLAGRWHWHASVAVYRPPAPCCIPWTDVTPTEQDAALGCLARMLRDVGEAAVTERLPEDYEQGIHVWVTLTDAELLQLPEGLPEGFAQK